MNFTNSLEKILSKYHELEQKLTTTLSSAELVKLSKEYSDLKPIVKVIQDYNNAKQELEELTNALSDENDEMKELITEERDALIHKIPELEKKVKIALIPRDEADLKNAIIEIRAGTGGEEAALFAASLFLMYQRYAENHKWKSEVLSISDTGIGGYKEASILISGAGVFSRLKFESGVHRVQRVPETESSGRVHTSAATVAVLPEAEEVDIQIDENDLEIDTYRASGAGGQHVNTTDSAVRITHKSSGLVVTQQDEKSQHKNKAKALKILRSRLYEFERQKLHQERSTTRKLQVGSGDRSERIRTYNFPQGRVTDHRINMTLYKINDILKEGRLDEIIDALIAQDEVDKLAEGVE